MKAKHSLSWRCTFPTAGWGLWPTVVPLNKKVARGDLSQWPWPWGGLWTWCSSWECSAQSPIHSNPLEPMCQESHGWSSIYGTARRPPRNWNVVVGATVCEILGHGGLEPCPALGDPVYPDPGPEAASLTYKAFYCCLNLECYQKSNIIHSLEKRLSVTPMASPPDQWRRICRYWYKML